jgi:hypothetical protein
MGAFEQYAPPTAKSLAPSRLVSSSPRKRSLVAGFPELRRYLIGAAIVAACLMVIVTGFAAFPLLKRSLGQGAIEWREHVSERGRFSVLFPHVARTTTIRDATKDRGVSEPLVTEGVKLHMVFKSAVVTVGYQDVQQSVEDKLDQIVRMTVGSDQVIRQQNVQMGQYRGIEVVSKPAGTSYVFSRRHFCIRNRFYTLEWVTANHEPSEADVQKFFESFRVLE